MPELSCKQRVNLLCSYLIWSEDQLRVKVFWAVCSFISSFFFSVRVSLLISAPLTLLHFGFRVFSLLARCLLRSLSISLWPFFSPSPGVIQGSGAGSKKPLKCWVLWEYFKRPFHHVHEATLETKLKYDLCETSINSLESFVAPFIVIYHFFLHFCCLFVVLQLVFLQIFLHVHSTCSSRKRKKWATGWW